MQVLQNLDTIKFLLSVIASLTAFNIALVGWVARKYIKRIDSNYRRINRVETEHRIFHKSKTGIN